MDAKNFKVGQKWRRRGGDVVTISDILDDSWLYPVRDELDCGYTQQGKYIASQDTSSGDLVELVEDVADAVDHFPHLEQKSVEVAVSAIPAPPKVVIPSHETLTLLRKQANHFNQMAVERSEEIQTVTEQRDALNLRIGELQAEFDQFIKAKDETRAFVDSVLPG